MKEKTTFENFNDHLKNGNTSPDIANTADNIHAETKYNQSLRENKTWCSYMENGFRTSRIIAETKSASDGVSTEHFIKDDDQ